MNVLTRRSVYVYVLKIGVLRIIWGNDRIWTVANIKCIGPQVFYHIRVQKQTKQKIKIHRTGRCQR